MSVIAPCEECGEETENDVAYRDGLSDRRTLCCEECGNIRSHNEPVRPA